MTTLSGQASKGEKGKPKFQSLNINNLISQSRGESLETHQQKNTLPRRHGMQILGKVPSTRRAPANLPSLKSEHSGSDAAVSLVPTGGPGWGKQDAPISTGSASSPTTTTTTSTGAPGASSPVLSTASSQPSCLSPAAAAVANAVLSPAAGANANVNATPKQPPNSALAPPMTMSAIHHHPGAPTAANSDKSWSAVMGGGGEPHPPPYQSAQFQHEFPSLAGDGAATAAATAAAAKAAASDTQYGPGPSLRPQTEGSWIQGGSRAANTSGASCTAANGAVSGDPAACLAPPPPTPGCTAIAKSNSGPLPGPPPLLAPVGLQLAAVAGSGTGTAVVVAAASTSSAVTTSATAIGANAGGGAASGNHLVPQFRGVVPSFMYRGSYQSNGHGLPNFQTMTNPLAGRSRFPAAGAAPTYIEPRQSARAGPPPDLDEVTPRPIIKEEDLNRMDDMTRDVGWASHDDIDYNQKLAFSDDDLPADREIRKKESEKSELVAGELRGAAPAAPRGWSVPRSGSGSHSQPVTPQTRAHPARLGEDDEYWKHKRRQLTEKVANAVELAKLRKEEEEKRFMESKEAAKKKFQKLEEKKRKKDFEESQAQGTINPSAIPPQSLASIPVPVADWEKGRERERSRTPNEPVDVKMQPPQMHREPDFRQLTQIEGRNFINKNSRSTEREISREREGRDRERERDRDRNDIRERDAPNFSRTFQSDLPPRFQKQQAERQSGTPSYHKANNSSSPQPQPTVTPSNISFAQQYDPRWVQNSTSYTNKSNSSGMSRKGDSNYDRDREDDRNSRRDRHTPDDVRHRPSDRERNYPENTRKICNNENRYYDDYRPYRRENNQDYEMKRTRDDDKWEQNRDRHYDDRKDENKKSQIQQDPFDENEMNRQTADWHRDKYSKDWDERAQDRHRDEGSQRPDSRDSRISKESMRDSDYTGNWADSPFDPSFKEEKKKDSYREERRQVPGPITKEKIEADDLKNEKRHLTQLKRSTLNQSIDKSDKKSDDKLEKKIDDAWIIRKKESSSDRNENCSSPKAWADSTSSTTALPENSKFMEALEKNNKKTASGESLHKSDSKNDVKKLEKDNADINKDKEEKHLQGLGPRTRADAKSHRTGWSGTYAVYHASNWPKRSGDSRGGRSSQRNRRTHSSRDWHATDSELSGDEISVSTESGKEDRSGRHTHLQRSPKPSKKSDKDEKNKDLKQDKLKCEKRYEQNSRSARENYIPRGEPSRHGRGGFRGPRSITSKRIEGYGIPPSKSPFGNQHDDKEKKLSSDEIGGEVISSDEKTKINQQGLSSAIIGSNRIQNKSDAQNKIPRNLEMDKRDRSKSRAHSGSRRQKSKSTKPHSSDIGEECWETTSENSDTENERREKGRKKSSVRVSQGFMQSSTSRQCGASGVGAATNSMSNQLHTRASMQSNRMSSEKRANSARTDTSIRPIRSSINAAQKQNKDVPSVHKDDTKNDVPASTTDGPKPKSERNEANDDLNNSDDKNITHFDADGFQEVRSKKNVKERQKVEEKILTRSTPKIEKEMSRNQKVKGTSQAMQLTPQQIANIPPLLGTPVNPPSTLNTNNKSSFERPRANKLPPRFAKQRENHRLQKAQMQQGICDVAEMNKLNQTISMYSIKDGSSSVATTASPASAPAPMPLSNAWDKPITSQLRSNQDPDTLLGITVDNCPELEHTHQSSTSSQRSSPSNDKMLCKAGQVQDKTLLDGSTPPVKTIIFENTNYKSTPVNANTDIAVKSKFTTHIKTQRNDKSRGNKLDDTEVDNTMISSFNKPMSDILNKGESKTEPIQMPLSFNKAEDNADMKLDFTFDPDLSQLTEDKGTKSLGLPRSMHAITSAQNTTMSPSTAELNLKIASVKKVWETTMPTVLEHSVGQEDNVTSTASFSTSFGPEPGSLDHSTAFSKGTDSPDDNHEGYSPSPNQSCTSNNTTNVCKVKPTQQLAGAGQVVHAVSAHHGSGQQHVTGVGVGATGSGQHSTMVGQNLISHPLSPPPPIQQMLGQPPQQYTSNQHINYQPSLGGSAQYGSISAIPSPPTVLFNSTQQMPTQGGLYGPFQIDQSQVLNTQGRSQFSQYPNPYGLGQTASSPYSAQSMYLQTAPPHPPPSAQPPPDIYQSLSSQYRMAATGPFGQSQQLANNPSTVLISSSSNSLMSATVKPSSQQISAIGTKAGAVGQAYQQQSQQGQQLYIPYDPTLQANYLSNPGVLQRGPTGPVQNSVVPGLQPSSSYYSGSGAQTGFYQQPGNSTMQSAQLHQTSYGLQGSVFGTHNQSHASAASLQSFGSQYLSSPMQMAAAAALTAQQQQYRSPTLPTPNYMKGVTNQHMTDQTGRSQQLKSPGANQQDVLASVFNSAPQISSPKSRQNCKQPPPQSSPTQHKYVSAYPTVNSQQSAQIPAKLYPPPIQRPVNFQPSLNSSLQGQGSGGVSNQRYRPAHTHAHTHNQSSRNSQRQYYGAQGSGISSSHSDKSDDSKLNENGPSVTMSSVTNSAVNKNTGSAVNQSPELIKDAVNKDEAIVKE